MIRYLEAIEQLPLEIKLPLMKAFELFKEEIAETVKRSDFEELKAVVRELAEAQKRTEQRVEELAEAQKRTEQRVEELAEAQKRTEQRVEELAEAQRETQKEVSRLDKALSELAEAQKASEARLTRLEQVVEELAEAQKRTEEELRKLIKEHEKTREMVSGLSDTVGYGLEDKIMPYIPDFAKKEYSIEVSVIDRRNIVYPDGKYDEINIYVEGRKNGGKVYLIGECKAKPGKKDISKFAEVLDRIKRYLDAPVYSFIAGYVFAPDVEKYIKGKYPEIKMMKSFEFEMRYSKISTSA